MANNYILSWWIWTNPIFTKAISPFDKVPNIISIWVSCHKCVVVWFSILSLCFSCDCWFVRWVVRFLYPRPGCINWYVIFIIGNSQSNSVVSRIIISMDRILLIWCLAISKAPMPTIRFCSVFCGPGKLHGFVNSTKIRTMCINVKTNNCKIGCWNRWGAWWRCYNYFNSAIFRTTYINQPLIAAIVRDARYNGCPWTWSAILWQLNFDSCISLWRGNSRKPVDISNGPTSKGFPSMRHSYSYT